MARQIPHRELRNNSASILREVEAGESFTVTNHGKIVARLLPPDGGDGVPALRFRKALAGKRFADLKSVKLDHPVQASLDYLRGDR